MERLCQLIQADAWAWTLFNKRDGMESEVYVSDIRGSFPQPSLVNLLRALEHPEMIALGSRCFCQAKENKSDAARPRHQLIDESIFERTDAHSAWKKADVGPLILSLRSLNGNSGGAIGLYRRYGRPKFSPDELQIAYVVFSEMPWLHEEGWIEVQGATEPPLSPRLKQTLDLLIQGQGHKQIAERMNLSVHTLRGYIKAIYQHFNVHSQAELMNHLRDRDKGVGI